MKFVIFDDIATLGAAAADRIIAAIEADPQAVIGLATGSSPLPLYDAWAQKAAASDLDQSQVRGFALDEYVGMDPAHPESYHSVIAREVVAKVGLRGDLVQVPDGSGDVRAAAAAYEEAIATAGGVDVQILGIGRNGHIGFNEPGSPADSRTREVPLTAETIADNARFFDSIDQVPTTSITQGLATIMQAREIVVIATGEAKAAAVAAAFTGAPVAEIPAGVLRHHQNVTWFLDTAAASELPADIRSAS